MGLRRKNDEDLFQESTMTFGQHLGELRTALVRAIKWLVIGCVIGFAFGNHVVDFIKRPLEIALKKYVQEQSFEIVKYPSDEEKAIKEAGLIPVPYFIKHGSNNPVLKNPEAINPNELPRNAVPPDLKKKSPQEAESKANPEITTPPGFDRIIVFRKLEDDERVKAKSMNTQEPFMMYLKGSFLLGFVLSSPMVFYHLWNFVAAGLYPSEKKYIHIYMPLSIGLFLVGAAIAYFFVFQYMLEFLLSFNKWMGIEPELRINEWLSLALLLPIGFGISFQLPLVMFFMERIGVVDVATYLSKWRMAVLIIFGIAAVFTPADPYSMLLNALPLTGLYFLGIGMCKWWPRDASGDKQIATS